jgi:hypothetical protein
MECWTLGSHASSFFFPTTTGVSVKVRGTTSCRSSTRHVSRHVSCAVPLRCAVEEPSQEQARACFACVGMQQSIHPHDFAVVCNAGGCQMCERLLLL